MQEHDVQCFGGGSQECASEGSEIADDCSTFSPRFLLFQENDSMWSVQMFPESPWVCSSNAGIE